MLRGISGGQKKRVTTGVWGSERAESALRLACATPTRDACTRGLDPPPPPTRLPRRACAHAHSGEMAVGSMRVLLADEISTGLDSNTTFQITKALRNLCARGGGGSQGARVRAWWRGGGGGAPPPPPPAGHVMKATVLVGLLHTPTHPPAHPHTHARTHPTPLHRPRDEGHDAGGPAAARPRDL